MNVGSAGSSVCTDVTVTAVGAVIVSVVVTVEPSIIIVLVTTRVSVVSQVLKHWEYSHSQVAVAVEAVVTQPPSTSVIVLGTTVM